MLIQPSQKAARLISGVRSMKNDNNKTTVSYSNHTELIDLSGRDLISVFGRKRAEVASSVGIEIPEESSAPISIPTGKVTSMTGEVADEVHDWPNASQGTSFRSLSLHFRDGVLIALEWNFTLKDFLPKKKPWYRRWF